MNIKIFRIVQTSLLLLTIIILGASFYMQYVRGLQPCPLCLMQRFCVVLLLILGIMGAIFSTFIRNLVITLAQIVVSLAGLLFAGRQLWLQSLPVGQAPACIPDFDVLFHYFPLKDVLHAMLWGTGDCAKVSGKLLGLSLPTWSALYFLIMLFGCGVAVFQLSKMTRQRRK